MRKFSEGLYQKNGMRKKRFKFCVFFEGSILFISSRIEKHKQDDKQLGTIYRLNAGSQWERRPHHTDQSAWSGEDILLLLG